jgi:glyoxylase-like metal-dependent hydrolase (beta-lactamase superfamily II)
MTHFVCVTCGAQFAEGDSEPPACPVCQDERQYVPPTGQAWTTLEQLRRDRGNLVRDEGDLVGIGTDPPFAIGQRALLVPHGERTLLWDCITLLGDEGTAEVERRGGLSGIAISHPHYYTGMVEWAHRFACPIHLHEDDARWIMRPDPAIELWSGETLDLGDDLTLIRCGGHFPGGTVLHWPGGAGGAGALLTGDIVQVIPDRRFVGFMYSYPNLIPLPGSTVSAIAAKLEPVAFEQIYGAWWGTVIGDGHAAVQRSAERYARALRKEVS